MSSSSDNDDYQQSVRLPSFQMPKKGKIKAKPMRLSMLLRPGTKNNKGGVRFPEQIGQSKRQNAPQQAELLDLEADESSNQLPHFSLASSSKDPSAQVPPADYLSSSSSSSDEAPAPLHGPDFYNTSSSDDERGDDESQPPQGFAEIAHRDTRDTRDRHSVRTNDLISPTRSIPHLGTVPQKTTSKASQGGAANSPRSSFLMPKRKSTTLKLSQGTDITDLDNSSSIATDRQSGIKGILRKMSLLDRDDSAGVDSSEIPEAPSRSDTFLGKVLAFASDLPLGMSGGGLTPGASRAPADPHALHNIDEELEVGMEQDDAIELQRLDFAKLSREAHDLLKGHVPDDTLRQLMPEDEVEGSETPHADSVGSESTMADDDQNQASSSKHALAKHSSNSFLTANPDLFLRGEANSEGAEHDMLLDEAEDGYIKPPTKVHAGVLSSLLKLYQNQEDDKSGFNLGGLTPSGTNTANVTEDDSDEDITGELDANLPSFQNAKPKTPKKEKVKLTKKLKKQKGRNISKQLKITVHIADILQRQRFILRMCKALMMYGAPTHRLEEYMVMTSRVLEIDGQFIYFPGCMIVSFGDASTRTSEVHLVRCAQGVNLLKLSDTHKIYKLVIHDLVGVEQAAVKLEELFQRPNPYSPLWCVFFYGLGLACVCPWAFGGGWLDMPISFGVGCCVGYLQFFVLSKLNLYLSVFEVTASIVVSFIARGIGSIHGGNTFCFAAICQGLLALILPGYIILCGSLELQLRNMVAGSVRMFYAIIYLLFLGFGITLGAALYGWVDKNATSDLRCKTGHTMDPKYRILLIPLYLLCLGLINQARWKQIPIMIVIASTGYVVTYFAGLHFLLVTEFTAALGAFVVGIMGNIYLRIWRGMAVSAMLPAIFVQVPSGIASQSTLLTGIDTANKITNGTKSTTSTTSDVGTLSFGATMVEVAIGISVGLFAAALVVYPFGKKRTGLFTL